MGKKKKEKVKIIEVDESLPEDKEELKKELIKLKAKQSKKKKDSWNAKDTLQIILFSLIILIAAFLFLYNNKNIIERQPESLSESSAGQGFLSEEIRPASEVFGVEPVPIGISSTKNQFTIRIREVIFEPTQTSLILQVENNSDSPVHLLAAQNSMLTDQTGRFYASDPFKSDSKLNGLIPSRGKALSTLVFEPVDASAKRLTYTLSVGGSLSDGSWYQTVDFNLP
ncbi:MAG: hypothetical protein ACOCQR_00680 [bacterium]